MACFKLSISRSRKVMQVVKVDGKVIEFKSAALVKELLVNHQGFGVKSSTKPGKFLPPNYELQLGKTYYLSPCKCPVPAADCISPAAVKRIKIVITKKQLEELLSKKMNSLATNWKPSLVPIPEENESINI